MTHEVIANGATRIMQFEQRIPASMHMAINNDFVQDHCAVIEEADKDPSSQNYYFYQSRNAKALIRCPIYMENGDLFGFVGIDFANELPKDSSKIVEDVKNKATDIGKFFAVTAE